MHAFSWWGGGQHVEAGASRVKIPGQRLGFKIHLALLYGLKNLWRVASPTFDGVLLLFPSSFVLVFQNSFSDG